MKVERLRIRDLPSAPLPRGALSPLSCRILASRGLSGPAAELRLSELLAPDELKGVTTAAHLLLETLKAGGRVLIVGDYDVDGATSTALMVHCLRYGYGAQVDYFIPSRFTHGYGLSPAVISAIAERTEPLPDLLITVDNGISSHAGIMAAQELGMKVLVTDHHLPGEEPCLADAVVNPNQPGCGFASKAACGCTVAFYLLVVLRQVAAGWLEEKGRCAPKMGDYLDLVALATIADVVPLDGNNRILVEQGLRRLRAGAARPGITALLEAAGRDPTRLSSQDLGFVLGPRLNAAGRMDDMTVGVACLLTDRVDDAKALAGMLEEFNQARKQVQSKMVDEAAGQVVQALRRAAMASEADPVHKHVLVVWDEHWHEGVVGLVAGRLKEQYQQPVLALCPGEDGHFKGSARSIPGVHMRDLLAWVDAQHPGLLHKFGGHAMAAGLTVAEEGLPRLQAALQEAASVLVPAEVWVSELCVDAVLTAQELTLSQAEELTQLGPWGQGCPAPLFVNAFAVVSQRWLNERHLKLQLKVDGANDAVDAIWFFCPLAAGTEIPPEVHLVYELSVNEYRGRRAVQLMIKAEITADLYQDAVSERAQLSTSTP